MGPSESIYNLLLRSTGRVTEELKLEGHKRHIYVDVDLNFYARTAFL